MRLVSNERAHWLAKHVLAHEPALRAWLQRRKVAGLEVDDVIQETYAILATRESVADIRFPKSYAFQVAHSVVMRHVRRARILPIRSLADLHQLEAAADAPSPEQETMDRDELLRLAEAISTLPGRTREAFILRQIEGLSQREIARRMGLSENTVEKHIARGVRLLLNRFGRGGNVAPKASKDVEAGVRLPNAKTRK
jgi:RNA polymerase sigma-70 factor (ECF subfamily)